MSILAEFEPYRKNEYLAFGWDADRHGRSCDNHILASVIACRILRDAGELDRDTIRCIWDFIFECETFDLALYRYPKQGPETSHDDYTAVIAYSTVFAYLDYDWKLNRFPHLIVTKTRKRHKTTLLGNIALGLEYMWHAYLVKKGDVSVQILLWLIAPIHYQKNRFLTWCMDIWQRRMYKLYGSASGMMNVWHNNPEKPYVKYVRPEFIWLPNQ